MKSRKPAEGSRNRPAGDAELSTNAGGLPGRWPCSPEGVSLGLLETREYEEVVFQAQPGDVLLLYSDGVTYHLDVGGRRVRTPAPGLRRQGRMPGVRGRIGGSILADLDRWSTTAFDDQTVFAIKVA